MEQQHAYGVTGSWKSHESPGILSCLYQQINQNHIAHCVYTHTYTHTHTHTHTHRHTHRDTHTHTHTHTDTHPHTRHFHRVPLWHTSFPSLSSLSPSPRRHTIPL